MAEPSVRTGMQGENHSRQLTLYDRGQGVASQKQQPAFPLQLRLSFLFCGKLKDKLVVD